LSRSQRWSAARWLVPVVIAVLGVGVVGWAVVIGYQVHGLTGTHRTPVQGAACGQDQLLFGSVELVISAATVIALAVAAWAVLRGRRWGRLMAVIAFLVYLWCLGVAEMLRGDPTRNPTCAELVLHDEPLWERFAGIFGGLVILSAFVWLVVWVVIWLVRRVVVPRVRSRRR
jgi:uncharacterized membrane protein (UPF0136 family)